MQIARQVACPSCGAPLPLKTARQHVICVFCNTSSLIDATQPAAAPQVSPQSGVSKEEIERLKQLVLDGKRDEAIELYAQKAGIPRPEAETAVNDMLLSEYWRLTRSMPINAFGFVLHTVLVGLGAGAALAGLALARDAPPYLVLVALGALFAVWQAVRFVPKIVSTWVSAFGAEGRARVAKLAVLRTFPACVIVQVAFEVTPTNGGQPFVDEETMMLKPESVGKLSPNNVIMVRFDEPKRSRVFPITPIHVVGVAGAGYR